MKKITTQFIPLLLVGFSLLLSFSACKKETIINGNNSSSPCQVNNTCEITFVNKNSSNPYNCYIDGDYAFQVNSSGGQNTATTTADGQSLKAVQASGYLLYPTVYTINMNIGMCSTGRWEF